MKTLSVEEAVVELNRALTREVVRDLMQSVAIKIEGSPSVDGRKGKRSAATRRKMRLAQRARWAAIRAARAAKARRSKKNGKR